MYKFNNKNQRIILPIIISDKPASATATHIKKYNDSPATRRFFIHCAKTANRTIIKMSKSIEKKLSKDPKTKLIFIDLVFVTINIGILYISYKTFNYIFYK